MTAGASAYRPTPKTVLVTGVGRALGALVAARLADVPEIDKVIGVDESVPAKLASSLRGKVRTLSAELSSGEIGGIIAAHDVEAVVHLGIAASPDYHAGGRAAMKEHNVIGTMQLLGACQHSPTVRKVVVRSSTAAYGASFRDPAVFTEDTEPRELPRGGFARDVLDIEGYVRGFRRRRPDVAATVLRFAPFIGTAADTSLTRYFSLPVVPTVFGRDPRLQFIHADDALEIIIRSVIEHHPGTYNVAGAGVLSLSQAIRRAGRVALPVLEPGMSAVASIARRTKVLDFSLDQLDLFVHGRVVDTSSLIHEFGFTPRSTPVAFDDFIASHAGLPSMGRDTIAALERRILGQIRAGRQRTKELT
jgi:UDP-glucose 4-epimerase